MERRLLCNRWRTPDGTILESKHVHDYVAHIDRNRDYYFVDGGLEYVRKSVNDEPMKDLCVYTDSDYGEIRKHYKRGTFDKEGARIWVPMENMSDSHLLACIIYNMDRREDPEAIDIASYLYAKELVYRFKNGFTVSEYPYTKENIKTEPQTAECPMRMPEGVETMETAGSMAFEDVVGVIVKYNDGGMEHSYELYCALANFMSKFEGNADKGKKGME